MLDYSFPRLFSRVARQALTYPIPSSPLRHAHFPLHRLRPNPSLSTPPASGRVHPLFFFFLNPFRSCADVLRFSESGGYTGSHLSHPSLYRMRTSVCTGSDLTHRPPPLPHMRTPSAQALTNPPLRFPHVALQYIPVFFVPWPGCPAASDAASDAVCLGDWTLAAVVPQ